MLEDLVDLIPVGLRQWPPRRVCSGGDVSIGACRSVVGATVFWVDVTTLDYF